MGYRKLILTVFLLLIPLANAQMLLEVDWSTSTGNSVAAVGDGGKGNPNLWCGGLWQGDNVLHSVPANNIANGDAFPLTDNVLRIWVTGTTGSSCGHVSFENVFPLPQAGDFWAMRYYTMNDRTQFESFHHPFTFWAAGDIEAAFQQFDTNDNPSNNGDWQFGMDFGEAYSHPFGYIGSWVAQSAQLRGGTWYRVEMIIEWRNTEEYRVYPRIYDMSDTLIADNNDFTFNSGFPPPILLDWYAENPNHWFHRRDPYDTIDAIRTPSFGRGQSPDPDLPVNSQGYYYAAAAAFGMASGINDYIGPYGGASCTDGASRSCGSDVGECSSGTQTCSSNVWGSCVGSTGPSTEVCDDTLDNDCDGTTDCSDSSCSSDPACAPPPPTCGDLTCDANETCSSCPSDCGACGATCGDNSCDVGETCSSCPGDCGTCPPSGTGPGDVNEDGMVDVDDLIMMTVNLGNSGFDLRTDINGDGRVNIFDMVVVARNYGKDYTSPPGPTCGDNSCDVGETCSSCPGDCGTCPPPSGELVAYYDFNEGTGTTLNDLSGNNNHGTINGATWTTGQTGNALNFDGVDDHVEISYSAGLDIIGDMTLMAWVNTPGEGFDAIIEKGDIGTAYGVFLSDRFIQFNLGLYYNTGQIISSNAWTHVALTYDGSRIRIYQDGIEVYDTPQTGPLASNTKPLRIGISGTEDPFLGMIDDVRIYNRALSQAEIIADMNS